MKKIEINKKNENKIMDIFEIVQSRASVLTINNFSDIMQIIADVEKRIDLNGKPKSVLNGSKIVYNFQQKFFSARERQPISTHFILIFEKNNWFIDLDSIKQDICPNIGKLYFYNLILSEAAEKNVNCCYY